MAAESEDNLSHVLWLLPCLSLLADTLLGPTLEHHVSLNHHALKLLFLFGRYAGSYFSQEYAGSSVAYSKHQSSVKAGSREAAAEVKLRQWTLGEVVTAVCTAGLRMCTLVEEQGNKLDDIGVPKLYTLVAKSEVA